MAECPRCEQMDQCARCGSSIAWKDCPTCAACMRSDDADPCCPACAGSGRASFCLSSYEWCQANPLPGREDVERHTVEWFTVPCPDCVEGTEREHAEVLTARDGDASGSSIGGADDGDA